MSDLLGDVSDEIEIITNDTQKVDDLLDDGQNLLDELQGEASTLARDARIALYVVGAILGLSFIICAVACATGKCARCCQRKSRASETVGRLL